MKALQGFLFFGSIFVFLIIQPKPTLMKKLLFLLIATTMLFTACKKETVTNKDRIIGYWESGQVIINGSNSTTLINFAYDFTPNDRFAVSTNSLAGNGNATGKYYFRTEDELVLVYDSGVVENYSLRFNGSRTINISGTVADGNTTYLVSITLEKK